MKRLVTAGVCVLAASLVAERDAEACGGCFQPQENPTVVTDHRMLFSIASDQVTLYDQIKYSGAPSSFGWVLPIAGTVDVGLSADVVFQTLDVLTTTRITPPPRNCPNPPNDCSHSSASGGVAQEAGVVLPPDGPGVTVTKSEVVGPYETVQLKATDANALETWLSMNGFTVPASVKPVIDTYVSEKFDFLAMKLLPNQGVNAMRPVRVTTPGANVVLPLRMVAAGTGATVGITLWVVGEGRYQPQNFPGFFISGDEIAWDWTQNKSNYVAIRAQKTAASGGRGWELENATTQAATSIQTDLMYGSGDAAHDYLPTKDAQGTIVKTAEQVRTEDLATLLHGLTAPRVTRLRTDLAHAALDADLVMTASTDQSEVPNVRQAKLETAEPSCPVYDGCMIVGSAPRSQAAAQSKGGDPSSSGGVTAGGGGCAIGNADASPLAALAGAGGFLALALSRARRRRRAEMLDKR